MVNAWPGEAPTGDALFQWAQTEIARGDAALELNFPVNDVGG